MKILLVSATPFEIEASRNWLEDICHKQTAVRYTRGNLAIDVLISGVGMAVTAFSLGTVMARERYDLCIQAGIAGAFDQQLNIGDVVEVISERFADLGAEDKDGSFMSLKQLGLQEHESSIFTSDGAILNLSGLNAKSGLKRVNAISVNKASGSVATIEALQNNYPSAQLESMEGAAFFYACRANEVAMLQLRAISNYVEPRNRKAWEIPKALNKLNEVLIALLATFIEQAESTNT